MACCLIVLSLIINGNTGFKNRNLWVCIAALWIRHSDLSFQLGDVNTHLHLIQETDLGALHQGHLKRDRGLNPGKLRDSPLVSNLLKKQLPPHHVEINWHNLPQQQNLIFYTLIKYSHRVQTQLLFWESCLTKHIVF